MMNRSLAVVFCALVMTWALPSVASAKPKVALTPIDGDVSGDVGEAVADALEGGELAVVPLKTVTRAVDKLGYDGELTEKQAKKVGSELDADAVVQGKLDKAGTSKTLHFTLFVKGKKEKGFTVSFKNPKSSTFKSMLRDKLSSKLGKATAASADEPADDSEDPIAKGDKGKKGKKGKKSDKADKEEAKAAEKAEKAEKADRAAEKAEKADKADKADKTAEADDEDPVKGKKAKKAKKADAAADEDDEEDPAPKKKKKRVARAEDEESDEQVDAELAMRRAGPPHAANRDAIRVDMGISFANRTLAFTKRGNFPQGPKPYKNSPVPGARLEVELYPLAFSQPKSFAAGLGLGIEYDKTLSLKLTTTNAAGTQVKANQQHYSVGPRLRIPFGSSQIAPSVTIAANYARRSFIADRSALGDMPGALDLPDTDYKSIDGGLLFRIPFAPVIALVFGGQVMGVLDAGPIVKGVNYGQAKVFGGSAEAGLDIVLGNRFAVRLRGEFVQIGYTFTGKGDMAKNRDGDPTTIDVGGAADRSIGGSATFAVLY